MPLTFKFVVLGALLANFSEFVEWIVDVEEERLNGLERGAKCVSFNSARSQTMM